MRYHSNKYLLALALVIALGATAIIALPSIPAGAQGDRDSGAMHKGAAVKSGTAGPAATSDDRQTLVLSRAEMSFVLTEMRGFLESVQVIVDGVAEGNMKEVAAAARKSGMIAITHAPRTLMKKLPKEFRMLGGDTHKKFDALATEADQIGDKGQILRQLSALLSNCTSCHATFRFSEN